MYRQSQASLPDLSPTYFLTQGLGEPGVYQLSRVTGP